jgi:hypothetical protein
MKRLEGFIYKLKSIKTKSEIKRSKSDPLCQPIDYHLCYMLDLLLVEHRMPHILQVNCSLIF